MKYPTPNRVGKSHKSSKSYGNSKSPTGVNSPLRHQAGQIIPCDKRNERKALKTDDGGHWPVPTSRSPTEASSRHRIIPCNGPKTL